MPRRADNATRARWARKLSAQSDLAFKALHDLLVMIAEADEAGLNTTEIAYNVHDVSPAAVMRDQPAGIHSSGVRTKVKQGNELRERAKS